MKFQIREKNPVFTAAAVFAVELVLDEVDAIASVDDEVPCPIISAVEVPLTSPFRR